MLTVAEFSMPRVLVAAGGMLAWVVGCVAAILWAFTTEPIVPPRHSYEGWAVRTALSLTLAAACGLGLLVLTGLNVRAAFRHRGAAILTVGDQAVLFNGGFFTTAALTGVREVNITSREVNMTWLPALRLPVLEVQLEAGRSIHVPLRFLRGEPEVIRQRLWDEVQAAKAQGRGD